MILGFKNQFRDSILLGTKVHTIRVDEKSRWKVGNKIHFATGVRTKDMNIFMRGDVKLVQDIQITFTKSKFLWEPVAIVDGVRLTDLKLRILAQMDGFADKYEMAHWFFPGGFLDKAPVFKGKLIHWTDFKY